MARVFLVEDDDQVRTMLRITLEREGYEVDDAPDGKAALRKVRSGPKPDVVITDIMMPDQDGLGTIMDLRREFPETGIIAISGGGSVVRHNYLDHARLLGASFTFAKPVERKKLLAAVGELLSGDKVR